MLITFLPIFIQVIMCYTAYKLTVYFGTRHEGVKKVKAKYENDGFSFEYNGRDYHVRRSGFGNKRYYNGQRYSIYVSIEDPNQIYESTKLAWSMIGIFVAIATFVCVNGLIISLSVIQIC
jgi:hypothetical protein